jgi:hypothetical protein
VIKRGWLREWSKAAWWIVSHGGRLFDQRRRVISAKEVPDRQLLHDGPLPFRREMAAGTLERAGQRALDALAAGYWRAVVRFV